MNKLGLLAFCTSVLLATGCTTTDTQPEVSDEDAARFNVQLGISYLQRGNLQDARDKLERAVEQDPDFPSAHAALGLLYERAGEMDKAGMHLRRAAQLAPDDAGMQNNYGGFLCRSGERKAGIEYFDRAARNAFYRTPEVALTNAGVCARGIPDVAMSERYLRRALEVNRTYSDALLQMADLKLDMDDFFNARAFMQRYEAVATATPVSLDLGRRIELGAGDARAAGQYERRLRQEFPDSPQTMRLD